MWELIVIAIGLAMDAFAVSICKGLSTEKATPSRALIAGAYFGGFQAVMPVAGYFLGVSFQEYIERIDHWIAFALLVLIGLSMIWESRKKEEEMTASFGPRAMLPLAVSTSIDALAVGVTFAIEGVNIWIAAAAIGVITFGLSAVGIKVGNVFGARYKSKAEIFGGVVLMLMGIKILLEHMGILRI